MKNLLKISKKELVNNLIALFIGLAGLTLGSVIYYANHFVSSIFLIGVAVAIYFYMQFFVTDKNWLDVTACFSLVWIFTLGLSTLRLLDYQKEWETLTWVIVILAYVFFFVGSFFGKVIVKNWLEKRQGKNISVKGYTLKVQEGRLFWICFVVTGVAFVCFILNAITKGYVPFFSESPSAYIDFSSKFHTVTIAGTMISGLSYYVLVKQWHKLPVWKKVFLIGSIVYSTLFIPTIVVSRSALLTSCLSLMCVMFYLHKRKLIVILLSLVVMAGFYAVGTMGRGYSETQLDEFFEPSEIEKPGDEDETFQISGKLAFVYSYLTVSHDNFNEAVINVKDYSFGLRQLLPFNALFEFGEIEENNYLVRPHLTTINVAGYAYYDFGVVGVALLMFIWAFVFGEMQSIATKENKPFALLTLGNALSPVILCFFSVWMSLFSQWMHWGLILIMYLVASITKEKKEEDTESAEEKEAKK